jgi:hypothetical protein
MALGSAGVSGGRGSSVAGSAASTDNGSGTVMGVGSGSGYGSTTQLHSPPAQGRGDLECVAPNRRCALEKMDLKRFRWLDLASRDSANLLRGGTATEPIRVKVVRKRLPFCPV